MAEAKIKLGKYPYTYVRAVVMRSLLFKKEDYHKMLKMGPSEIAKLLQESNYRKDIDLFAASYSGTELIELALNSSLSHSMKKLLKIAAPELRLLIREYAKRSDVQDVKTIIRGKFTNTDNLLIQKSLTMSGVMGVEEFSSLMKNSTVEQVLVDSRMLDRASLSATMRHFNEEKNLVAIENALDRAYYSNILKFSNRIPKDGSLFKEFLLKEIETRNLITLLRLKKAKFPKKQVEEFIITTNNPAINRLVNRLSQMDSIDDMADSLSKTEYGAVAAGGLDEYKKSGSLIKIETELFQRLLKKSIRMLHMNPLSVDVILGYMFAKEIEVRNLRILVKGKQLGLTEDFIESRLVID